MDSCLAPSLRVKIKPYEKGFSTLKLLAKANLYGVPFVSKLNYVFFCYIICRHRFINVDLGFINNEEVYINRELTHK